MQNNPVYWIDPYGLAPDWGAIAKGSFHIVLGGATVVVGAWATSTPTGIGQVVGTTMVLGGSSTFSFGVSEVITGAMGKGLPFDGGKEAIIIGNTQPGTTRNALLDANQIIDMIPDIVAGGSIPTSKIGEAIDFIDYSFSIGKSINQIIDELIRAGYIEKNCN